jgi:hypothetical protein
MKAINVKKSELLDKLRANRESHSAQFEEAAQGYRERVIAELESRLALAKKGKLPTLVFNLPMPFDQTKAYDRAIGMLELSVDDVIELEEDDYKQYVLDEWAWSASASATNLMYSKKL